MRSNFPTALAPFSRLEELLPRWREVPLYRNALAQREIAPAEFDVGADFFRLPFITKREMREDFPRNFLGSGQRLKTLLDERVIEMEHTSGTSEEQVPVLFGRGWWDEQEERALRLNALIGRVLDEFPAARRATITPPTCNGSACYSSWLSCAERTVGRTLYANLARIPFLWKDAEMARMAAEIAAWSPQFLDVDPVHGMWFALYCEREGLRFPSLRFILGSYEFVSVNHRRILQRVFGVPVFNLYGSTETGHLLMEDEHGAMKPSAETAFLEVVEPDENGVGDLVVTTLSNEYMPLVRYRIGDLVQRRETPRGISYLVHGRARDALRRGDDGRDGGRDGRRVTTHDVDQCFVGLDGVAHYQLLQNEIGGCRLEFVPDRAGPTLEAQKEITTRLENLLQSPHPITMAPTEFLPPTPSGKFRLTHRA